MDEPGIGEEKYKVNKISLDEVKGVPKVNQTHSTVNRSGSKTTETKVNDGMNGPTMGGK